MVKALVLGATDNVATLISEGKQGDECRLQGPKNGTIILKGAIPYGHKVALTDLNAGDDVMKYGQVIGRMTRAVKQGEHVHVHNVESIRGRGDLEKLRNSR